MQGVADGGRDLTGDMEDFLGCNIDPTIMYDYSTVKALAQHLAEELKVKA